MVRKGKTLTLSVNPEDQAKLEALSLQFGQTWGDKPNVSKLVKAIARGELVLSRPGDTPQDRLAAEYRKIEQAIAAIQAIAAETTV